MSYLDRHVLIRALGKDKASKTDCTLQDGDSLVYTSRWGSSPKHCKEDLLIHAYAAIHLALKLHSPGSAHPDVCGRRLGHEHRDLLHDAQFDSARSRELGRVVTESNFYHRRSTVTRILQARWGTSTQRTEMMLDSAEQDLLDDLDFYLHPATTYGIAAEMIAVVLGRNTLDRVGGATGSGITDDANVMEVEQTDELDHPYDECEDHRLSHPPPPQARHADSSTTTTGHPKPAIFDEGWLVRLTNAQLNAAQDQDGLRAISKSTIARAAVSNTLMGLARATSYQDTSPDETLAKIDAAHRHRVAIRDIIEMERGSPMTSKDDALHVSVMNYLEPHRKLYQRQRFREQKRSGILASRGVRVIKDQHHDDKTNDATESSPVPQRIVPRTKSPQSVVDYPTDATAAECSKADEQVDLSSVQTNKQDERKEPVKIIERKEAVKIIEKQSVADRALSLRRGVYCGALVNLNKSIKKRRTTGSGGGGAIKDTRGGSTPHPSSGRRYGRGRAILK